MKKIDRVEGKLSLGGAGWVGLGMAVMIRVDLGGKAGTTMA